MAPSVGITNTAAAQAARDLGCTPAQARTFLEKQVRSGRVVASNELPPPHTGRRSKTDKFLLIDRTAALPLAGDQRDPNGFAATGCFFFEEYLRANGRGRSEVDPQALSGAKLMEQVDLSVHAVERYQQRAGGHPDPEVARDQMRRRLSRDARAAAKRPPWASSSRGADFFLLAGGAEGEEEFCLPVARHGGGGKPFEAVTCLHRSQPLFTLASADLAGQVAFTQDVLGALDRLLPGDGPPADRFRSMISVSGRLSWHPPYGHPGDRRARFYLIADTVFVPLAWDKKSRVPFIALDVHGTRLPMLRRLAGWLRRRFSLRVT